MIKFCKANAKEVISLKKYIRNSITMNLIKADFKYIKKCGLVSKTTSSPERNFLVFLI
jgi:hypothetical protein